MIAHVQVWQALDGLASRYGLSPSGLARKAGLDPTSFNRSKRIGVDGRERWPSTESIAKVLHATGAGLEEFIMLVEQDTKKPLKASTIPLIDFSEAARGGFFDDGGMPTGNGWDEVAFPDFDAGQVFAFEVSGPSMQPLYRDGDIIIVSPSAQVRRGDRVVVKLISGEVMAKELRRKTAKSVELRSLNPDQEDLVLDMTQIAWMARVMWASQ
jgi:phage repressor protein C with HTH and peptisase S24 domain